MPSFKPKTAKKIKYNKKNAITLDGKHKEFMNDFSKDDYDRIPQLQSERKVLQSKLENLDLNVEQRLDITDRINEIKETIREHKLRKKEYLLDNSKFIFDYFENKKNISEGTVMTKNQKLNSFFKIKEDETMEESCQQKTQNIVQQYLSNIDDSFLDVNAFISQSDICKYCNKGELIPLEDEGILICNLCSRHIPYLIENEKTSYKEPPKEV